MDTEFRKPKFKWHVFYTRLIPLVRNVDILWNSLHSEFNRKKNGAATTNAMTFCGCSRIFRAAAKLLLTSIGCMYRLHLRVFGVRFLNSVCGLFCLLPWSSPAARRRRHRTRKNIQSQFLYVVPRTMCISMHKTRTHIPNAFICSVFSCCTLLFLCLSSHFVFVMLI